MAVVRHSAKLLLTYDRKLCEKSIGTKVNDLDLCLDGVDEPVCFLFSKFFLITELYDTSNLRLVQVLMGK